MTTNSFKNLYKPYIYQEQEETEQPIYTEYTGDKTPTNRAEAMIIPTSTLLDTFITNVKQGKVNVVTKAESDRDFIKVVGDKYKDCITKYLEPIKNNYLYNFTDNTYNPVEFSVTKIKRTYGFLRYDTGEYCNFTIIKKKDGRGFTFCLKPIDSFNLPEQAGG